MSAIPTAVSGGDWSIPSRARVGVACLIATEAALFMVFVVAYVFYIGKSLAGPLPANVLTVPIAATMALLSSSITITVAIGALERGRHVAFRLFWLLTILLGVTFLAATAIEWRRLIFVERLTIGTNLFGTTFYSLVGLHAAHVTIGLLLLSLIFVVSWRGALSRRHHEHVEVLSWYWHFVDVVWVVVFFTVYVVGR